VRELLLSTTGFFAAAILLVDGRPGATFRFLGRDPAFFIAVFDMFGFALLFIGVG